MNIYKNTAASAGSCTQQLRLLHTHRDHHREAPVTLNPRPRGATRERFNESDCCGSSLYSPLLVVNFPRSARAAFVLMVAFRLRLKSRVSFSFSVRLLPDSRYNGLNTNVCLVVWHGECGRLCWRNIGQ